MISFGFDMMVNVGLKLNKFYSSKSPLLSMSLRSGSHTRQTLHTLRIFIYKSQTQLHYQNLLKDFIICWHDGIL